MNMKKFFLILLISFFGIILASCNRIKEYDRKEIVKLSYHTIDFNGGYRSNMVLDFVNNQYLTNGYLPSQEHEPELEVKRTFSEEEEKVFINGCYSMGLFNLKDKYEKDGIIDGGSWSISIEYIDGSSKVSFGINDGPSETFNRCSTFFYDLCGVEVLGTLPEFYLHPPIVSYAFGYDIGEYGTGSDNSIAMIGGVNYKWNKSESSDTNKNLYLINESYTKKNKFLPNNKYQFFLYTTNYHSKERFTKIVIKNYDYNQELTNEKIVYEGSWFIQIEIELEMNKIYFYKIEYRDGDFLERTFNTKCLDSKILYGQYYYSIYEEGQSTLIMNDDGTYELFQFEYSDRSKNVNESIKGQYTFETIDEKEFLCLYTEDEKRIVLEYYTNTFVVNSDLSTFNLTSYHLEDKPGPMHGKACFSFWK